MRQTIHRYKNWVSVAVAVVVAVTVATGVSGAAPTQLPSGAPTKDNVIHLPATDPLPDARTVVESGVMENDECLVQGHLEGTGGDPGVIVQRIVEVNLTTCEITLERISAPLADLHMYDQAAPSDAQTMSETASSAAVGPLLLTAVNHYVGSIKVNYEDWPQIDVTTTKSTVRWRQNQGASCLAGANFDAHWGWYSPSGWRRDTASWQHDFECGFASMNTYGTYSNSEFCPTGTTYTDHYNTFYQGRPNGGWYAQWGSDKSGGCAWMLSREHIIVHP